MKRLLNIMLLATILALVSTTVGMSMSKVYAKGSWEDFRSTGFSAEGVSDTSVAFAGETSGVLAGNNITYPSTFSTLNNWTALGAGLNSYVKGIAVSSTGDVYAVGSFIDAGGYISADSIAKWNGTSWSALGTLALNGSINAIAISETDELYIGGIFTNAGGDANADYIAKWNGTSWSALGTTPLTDEVFSIAVNGNEVYAGGFFLNAGGDSNADRIAKWNGTSWSALSAPFSANVFSIAIDKTTGDVYAGGGFTNAGGDANADYIAKWNGTSWSALGAIPLNSSVYTIAISETGDLYAGGNFTNAANNPNADRIAKWDGTSWSALGTTPTTPTYYLYGRAIAIRGTEVYAGFSTGGGSESAMFIAKWDGLEWSDPASTQLTYNVSTIAIKGTKLYVGGSFTNAGGDSNADRITKLELPGISDSTAPAVDSFVTPSIVTLLDIPINAFTASDNVAVTGYLITESATIRASDDAGWSGTVPTIHAVGAEGNYTLFPWVKDAAGNVSAAFGSPASVSVDTSAPTVTLFTATSPSTSLEISITAFTASDTVGVTGYLVTESATPPSAGDANWTALAPATYMVGSEGSFALYPWVKDAVGNVSAVYGSPSSVNVHIPTPLIVTKAADTDDGVCDNDCTLREAINAANADSDASKITFDANYIITLAGSQLPVVTTTITIEGNGKANTILQANVNPNTATNRVLEVNSMGNLTLNDLAVRNGRCNGACSTINAVGGGIFNYGGVLKVMNITVSGNYAGVYGGSIYNNGTLTVTNSTFSANSAFDGGGIYNDQNGATVVSNSTFAANSAGQDGGGIYNSGTLTLTNSTLSGNSAFDGSGTKNYHILNFTNTIIANSAGGNDCVNIATLGTNTNNLVEDGSCSASLNGDPNLDLLQDNGGPTQTMALGVGSLAIDAGDDANCPDTDQRGVARPQGSHCDIGAFEVEGANIDVYIGDNDLPLASYSINDGESVTPFYDGVANGPVQVVSTNGVNILASEHRNYQASFSETLGYPADQLTTAYWFTRYAYNANVKTWLLVTNPSGSDADVEIYIGDLTTPVDSFTLTQGTAVSKYYDGLADGPVLVKSTNGVEILTSEHRNYQTSFSETLGYPADQLTTKYWFTRYAYNANVKTWLLITNPSNADADVEIYIGDLTTPVDSFSLTQGSSVSKFYNGLADGPVLVKSTNGVNILASEHRNYQTSFSETLGYSANQLTTEYWFTRYAYNANVKTWLLIANPDPSQTAEVSVYIGTSPDPIASYSIGHGQTVTPFYDGVANGPVRVVSTNGVEILASEHRNYQTSFSETLGYPDNQLTTKYWFTRYAYNPNVKTWLLIANPQ